MKTKPSKKASPRARAHSRTPRKKHRDNSQERARSVSSHSRERGIVYGGSFGSWTADFADHPNQPMGGGRFAQEVGAGITVNIHMPHKIKSYHIHIKKNSATESK